ncbi:MAG: flagellar basal body rod protein FlgB [Candidatus Zixiibacteriota bacterium]|nr:MAG: flagellar basal body rod protein FlgB [candidate division Zixibacteria bacterium]
MENKIAEFLFNRTGVGNFRKFLNVASFRQKLIAGNVANSSTPVYKSRDIDFHREFNRITKNDSRLSGVTTHPAHIPTGNHESKPPEPEEAEVIDGDLNSVDIDQEISNLAQNELLFTVGATLLQRKFEGIRKAIQSR